MVLGNSGVLAAFMIWVALVAYGFRAVVLQVILMNLLDLETLSIN